MDHRKQADAMTAVFRSALQTFVDKVKQDDQVIAVVLLGSLSYDQVWEKSDIDLKLIVHDQKLKYGYRTFVENDVPINASITTRNDFKREMERTVQGSFGHSMLVRSTLLFTKDSSIQSYFEQIRYVGERDRQLRLLQLSCFSLSLLAKAEKWQYVKRDFTYSAFWIIKMIDTLSQIEVLLNGDIPMRECVQQALTYNPDFFGTVYAGLIVAEVREDKVDAALKSINTYMNDRAERLFAPVLAYLKEEADVRTATDIMHKFGLVIDLDAGAITTGCDWLAEHGLIAKLESDTKATPASRVSLSEPAYLFENLEDMQWGM
ncbi:hypothetical protein [Paenibacillus harenae]|uniref:Polymerase beta nucleotidyltransferase domain-containing protein n=1 Tax=Paenibacillus harenae TaxID=306543 RepID=A0ABT9TYM0_PAEHA|nr:hypothetical protein [Paenibacillus harenae]MDQ0059974.1 hypothetical protein [Paenibacillus harenae]MDQ0112474.1 hypothetical protein [Paenibacillus harenae]